MMIYCSFCGKSQHDVHKLFLGITGDTYICNECVALCANLLLSDLKPTPKTEEMITKLDKWIKENR